MKAEERFAGYALAVFGMGMAIVFAKAAWVLLVGPLLGACR